MRHKRHAAHGLIGLMCEPITIWCRIGVLDKTHARVTHIDSASYKSPKIHRVCTALPDTSLIVIRLPDRLHSLTRLVTITLEFATLLDSRLCWSRRVF